MANSSSVHQVYKTVVEDVMSNVKEAFLDDGVDEQVLQELRQLWETKLQASKALDTTTTEHETLLHKPHLFLTQQQPQVVPGTATVQQSIPVPIQIATGVRQDMGAAATATMALPPGILQQQITALSAAGNTIQLHPAGNGQYIQLLSHQLQQHQPQVTSSGLQLPQHATIIQSNQMGGAPTIQGMPGLQNIQIAAGQQVRLANPTNQGLIQHDGAGDTSSSEDDDYDDNDNDDENDDENNEEEEQGEEEEPLNSGDDVSEQDPDELFDTDNVVVCQYDKINRNKNKWKFHLKDGIMNLNGRDLVFQKATGDAEW